MSENNKTKLTKEQWKEREFGALWKRKSGTGTTYLTGKIDGKKVVVFGAKDKLNENQPDFRVYLSEEQEAKPANKTATPVKPAPKKAVSVSEDDDGVF